MPGNITRNRAAGAVLLVLTLLVIAGEWRLWDVPWQVLAALVALVPVLFWADLGRGRRAFVVVALGLVVANLGLGAGGRAAIARAAETGAFIAAFFAALATLRAAAASARGIARAGRYLAERPPGQRYGALTLGGQLFALPLSYGAIQLLGALALASTETEPDPEIRRHRTRRMLLAIQRAFISTLAWSPLSFAMAISTSVVAGTSWGKAVLPGLVTMALFAGTGWAMDTIFKPRLARRAPPPPATGTPARAMLPLAALLVLLVVPTLAVHLGLGIRVVGAVLLIVPLLSAGWVVLQRRGQPEAPGLSARAGDYLFRELPGYRGEIVLLSMAGVIGSVGAPVLAPLVQATPLDPAGLPGWAVLTGLVWLIPLCGQFGMNPILAVTLLAPLIPDPAAIGVTPTALIVAITSGWTLSGVTSPFTATTLLVGSFAGVSARHVGLVWNGLYAATLGVLCSAWALIYASWF
jgi:hypothetical protein